MNIEQDIANWDGKSVQDLNAIYDRYHDDKAFIPALLECLQQHYSDSESHLSAATWLIKHYLEVGNTLSAETVTDIYRCLPDLTHWESKLNLLQCMEKMPIAESVKPQLKLFLRHNLTDDNKFVRAWAYNGFYLLSRQYPEYQAEAKQFCKMAMRDEAPSVKARIRNIMKQGF